MRLKVTLFSFWDTPHEFDCLGISDYSNTLAIWHDGLIDCLHNEVEVEPDGKIWDFLFSFLSRISEYEPSEVINSGGSDVYKWEIEL